MTSNTPPRNQYFKAALNLRSSIERNEHDAHFANTPGNEIIYIFDTNIFVFHADLTDRQPLTEDFDNLVGEASNPTVQRAMERLTADYLFSRALPGQGGRPGYVAPQHFDEILRNSEAIAKRLAGEVVGQTKARRGIVAVARKQIEDVLAADLENDEKLTRLSKIMPAAWLNALDAISHFTHATRRAFLEKNPGLVPVGMTDWGRGADHISDAEIENWRKVLPTAKNDADAEALATIVNIYKNDKDAQYENRKRLYLFVTTHKPIGRAVEERAQELGLAGIPSFVRFPQDYHPLINLNAMRDAAMPGTTHDGLSENFQRVFVALNSALEWISKDLDWDRVEQTEIRGNIEKTSIVINNLHSSWAKACEFATMITTNYAESSAVRLSEDIKKFISSQDSVEYSARALEESVVAVRDKHMAISIESALAAAKFARFTSADGPGRRIHIKLIGENFSRILGHEQNTNDFLDNAVEAGKLPETAFKALSEEPDRSDAQLFAACILSSAERWQMAAPFAGRALDLATKRWSPHEKCEAAYLYALCLRFSMQNADQFDSAYQALLENQKYYAEQRSHGVPMTLRRIRDQIELGSLLMTGAVNQEILRSEFIASPRQHRSDFQLILRKQSSSENLRQGAKYIQLGYDELVGSEPFEAASSQHAFTHTAIEEIVEYLKAQSLTNLCGVFLFERIVPGLQGDRPIISNGSNYLLLFEKFMNSSRIQNRALRVTLDIYECVMRSLTENDSVKRREAILRGLLLINGIKTNFNRLAVCDRLEFSALTRWLNKSLSYDPVI